MDYVNMQQIDKSLRILRKFSKNPDIRGKKGLKKGLKYYNSLIVQKKMVKEDRNFKLGKIISRAQSASSTKRKEISCFGCESLQIRIGISIICSSLMQ